MRIEYGLLFTLCFMFGMILAGCQLIYVAAFFFIVFTIGVFWPEKDTGNEKYYNDDRDIKINQ